MHLDFVEALRYNAILVILIPYLFLVLVSTILRTKCQKFYLAINNPYVIIGVFVILILWWIFRIIFGWYVA